MKAPDPHTPTKGVGWEIRESFPQLCDMLARALSSELLRNKAQKMLRACDWMRQGPVAQPRDRDTFRSIPTAQGSTGEVGILERMGQGRDGVRG